MSQFLTNENIKRWVHRREDVIFTARIHESNQIYQDVFCYAVKSCVDWSSDFGPVFAYSIEIKMPLFVTPDDIATDVHESLCDEEGINSANITEINYTLAPKDSI